MKIIKKIFKKKPRIKIGLLLIASLLSIMLINSTLCATVKITEVGLKYWHARPGANGKYPAWGQMGSFTTSTGQQSYCIDPGREFITANFDLHSFRDEDIIEQINKTNKSVNQFDRDKLSLISKYAYYGYGYGDHTSQKWIPATQMLIWRTLHPTERFANTLPTSSNFKLLTDEEVGLVDEMAEIQRLVDNHNVRPSFDSTNLTMNLGETRELIDSNGVLSQYQIESTQNCSAYISGNSLFVTSTGIGNVSVNLMKGANVYNEDLYFALSSKSQNQVVRGNIDPVESYIYGTSFGGEVNLMKTSIQDGKPVIGATYEVRNSDNNVVCTLVTDENGNAGCGSLNVGAYTVREVSAPTGYKIDETVYNVWLDANHPTENLKVSDSYIVGRVRILKKDSETKNNIAQGGATLEGAVYGIYDLNDNLITSIRTNKEGVAESDDIIYGSYYIKEVTPSEGYYLDEQKYYFDINTVDQKILEYTSYEQVIKREFKLTKTYTELVTMEMKAEKDAIFELKLVGSDKVVATLTTNDDGFASVTLPYGLYEVTQTKGITGHYLVDPFTIDLREQDQNKIYNNNSITAKLRIVKTDSKTNKVVPLSNISFKIKNRDTNEYVCQSITYPNVETICEFKTNDDGVVTTPSELAPGKYQIEELDSSILGYVWNQEPLKFEIGHNSVIERDPVYGDILEIRFANNPVEGIIKVQKNGEKVIFKDNSFYYEEIPLKDVKIGLYAREDIYDGTKTLKYTKDSLVTTLATDSNGYAEAQNLTLGKYYLKELETNEDHILDTKEYDFELIYKDQYTPIIEESITLKNYKKKSTAELSKTDVANGEPIPNTTMKLYYVENKKETLIFTGKTNAEGKLVIDELPQGDYYFIESEAAPKYVLTDQKIKFTIKENGEIVKSSLTNVRYSTFTITKKNLTGTEAVPGAKIEVYKVIDEETEELFYKGVTDAEGKLYIDELPQGNYYFIETEAPEGYKINEEKHLFTISADGVNYEDVFSNEKYSIVEFYKHDFSDESILLAGATICVYTEDGELVGCEVTNEEGFAAIKLPIGSYYYVETIAPEGYYLDEETHYFDITEEGSTLVADIFDEFIIVAAPNTGITDTELIIGIGLLLLGIALVVINPKRKEEKNEKTK